MPEHASDGLARLHTADTPTDTNSPSDGRRDSLHFPGPRVPSRSPHPYHRRSVIDGFTRIRPDLASKSREEHVVRASSRKSSSTSLNRRKSRDDDGGSTPSESGTEADDEAGAHLRLLPAPPLRPRKGLKSGVGIAIGFDGTSTPLLTPSAIDDEGRRFRFRFGEEGEREGKTQRGRQMMEDAEDEETRRARARFVKRRRAELGRRASEVLLLIVLGLLVLANGAVRAAMATSYRVELLSYISIVTGLYLLYPVRLTVYSWKQTTSWKPAPRTISLPAAFDPAPILYPQFLPVMIALILLPAYPKVLLPTLVLGLASVPAGLYRFGNWDIEPLRWLVSIVPLVAADHMDFLHTISAIKPYRNTPTPAGLHPETVVMLYPLHQTLVLLLHYLTSTSLLPAEVHLMSIGLINLLLCTEMPHTTILKVILWAGGLGLLNLCGPPIRWNIALARIPRWRLRRAGRLVRVREACLASLNHAMPRSRSVSGRLALDSDADDDEHEDAPPRRPSLLTFAGLKQELFGGARRTNSFPLVINTETKVPKSGVEASFGKAAETVGNGFAPRPRSYTMPVPAVHSLSQSEEPAPRRRKSQRTADRTSLSLTRSGAAVRKWLYALYTYLIMLLLVFGPIRSLIARYALNGHEPFGWAIGYLFGNLPQVRFYIHHWDLDAWAALPAPHAPLKASQLLQLGRAERVTQVLGEATTRLLLCGWCLFILLSGLLLVLSFTFVEVDTRRKVFHGMMVVMLLPTIFVDPAFVSLALTIVLALFLLLDLLRASQLPPLSKPIAAFLTPYVDGRDLRGPVVVSHIFLLVGCAVPLWLSLAGMSFSGPPPWTNWSLDARDVSMVSGVVCVGMGDAAASLIGRRYGRRKWPWTGGKSLEGSAAFAVAVTTGLLAAKLWLLVGGWREERRLGPMDWWAVSFAKAVGAASGASFMEAVLTGGNDNVVVPVGLWLFVKALEL